MRYRSPAWELTPETFALLLDHDFVYDSSCMGDDRPYLEEAAERFFANLGFLAEWVGDAPGLVLGRIVCQLVNEAAFAIGEGAGSAEDVDTGLTLGLSHPRGPVAWSKEIGLDHVLAVIDGLWEERREERYRAAPALRRAGA